MIKFNFKNEDYPLKRFLDFFGYTQQSFAEEHGISQSTVSRMCKLLKLPIDKLPIFYEACVEEVCEDTPSYIELNKTIKEEINSHYGKKKQNS